MKENFNIEAHYTNNPKVTINKSVNKNLPKQFPERHILTDEELSKRIDAINQDIYVNTKQEEIKTAKNFSKLFIISIISILTFFGLYKCFKKS